MRKFAVSAAAWVYRRLVGGATQSYNVSRVIAGIGGTGRASHSAQGYP